MSITYYVLSTKNLVIFVSDVPLRTFKIFSQCDHLYCESGSKRCQMYNKV